MNSYVRNDHPTKVLQTVAAIRLFQDQHGGLVPSCRELGELLGVTFTTAARRLDGAIAYGAVQRSGKKKAARAYRVVGT